MKFASLLSALLLAAAANAFPNTQVTTVQPPASGTSPPVAAPATNKVSDSQPTGGDHSSPVPQSTNTSSNPSTPARPATQGAKLYAPAAQLINWPMKIMVSSDLPDGANPTLTLLIAHGHSESERSACADITPLAVSRHQSWVGGADTDHVNAEHVGTLLLFDLSSKACKFDSLKPMTRARPILEWTTDEKPCPDCRLIGAELISLGDAPTAFMESLLAVVAVVAVLLVIARSGGGRRIVAFFFSVDEGTLSLSMVQMALWTIAAALMVLFEAMLRLDTPVVPPSIVVLMGMSVVTTGFSYHLTANPPRGNAPPIKPLPPAPPRLSDLLAAPLPGGGTTLSLARAQMLLWTLVMVVLFIAKSAINQSLWDIPWPLVALMGVSQAGYLGGKFSQ